MKNPIRTTVAFALVSGLTAVPLAMLMSPYLTWPAAWRMVLWTDFAIYGILLARWGATPLSSLVFPLAILGASALWPPAGSVFFILAPAVLAWIRSGICFQGSPVRTTLAEVVAIGGGTVLVMALNGHSNLSLALNLCLFLLVQTLYFYLVPVGSKPSETQVSVDPFEQAVAGASKILDGL